MRRGFSLIEVVVYLAILALLITSAVRLVLASSFNVAAVRAERKIMADGGFAMQAMIREIRLSSGTGAGSVFGTSPGTLALTTLLGPGESTETTKTFSRAGARLVRQAPSSPSEFLTSSDARVTNLTFWRSANAKSDLIRIKLTLEAGQGRSLESATFYGAAVFRRKY